MQHLQGSPPFSSSLAITCLLLTKKSKTNGAIPAAATTNGANPTTIGTTPAEIGTNPPAKASTIAALHQQLQPQQQNNNGGLNDNSSNTNLIEVLIFQTQQRLQRTPSVSRLDQMQQQQQSE